PPHPSTGFAGPPPLSGEAFFILPKASRRGSYSLPRRGRGTIGKGDGGGVPFQAKPEMASAKPTNSSAVLQILRKRAILPLTTIFGGTYFGMD
ncbi:MAG: hypothetical protein LUH18_04350, partial [Oscillospiraceae bacterium]|nr:hypothetical protein [Oscillospiraceae bacterium]